MKGFMVFVMILIWYFWGSIDLDAPNEISENDRAELQVLLDNLE